MSSMQSIITGSGVIGEDGSTFCSGLNSLFMITGGFGAIRLVFSSTFATGGDKLFDNFKVGVWKSELLSIDDVSDSFGYVIVVVNPKSMVS